MAETPNPYKGEMPRERGDRSPLDVLGHVEDLKGKAREMYTQVQQVLREVQTFFVDLPVKENSDSTLGFKLDDIRGMDVGKKKNLLKNVSAAQQIGTLDWKTKMRLSIVRYALETELHPIDTEKKNQYEELIARLKPGDIVLTYPGSNKDADIISNVTDSIIGKSITMSQDSAFRSTHIAVYIGDGKIADVVGEEKQGQSGRVANLKGLLEKGKYAGVTIGRFKTTMVKEKQVEQFTKQAQKFVEGIDTYDRKGFTDRGLQLVGDKIFGKSKQKPSSKNFADRSAICWDVPIESAKRAGIDYFKDIEKPIEILEQPCIECVYSVAFKKTK